MACCGSNKKKSQTKVNRTISSPSSSPIDHDLTEELVPLASISKIHDYPRARLSMCNVCLDNEFGVCLELKKQQPKNPCLVEIGVEKPESSCPKSIWPSHIPEHYSNKNVCSKCERVHDYAAIICKHCVYELERVRRNLNKGIGHNPTLLRFERWRNKDNDSKSIDYSVVANPFDKKPIKHLHYFLYPRYEESLNYHLDHLKKIMGTFNGKRVCCIATDKHTLEEKYKYQLEQIFTDIYYLPNDPNKRERLGFISSLEQLKTTNKDEVICFAHGKGQQYHTQVSPIIRKWTDAMYETCVGNWSEVKTAMEKGYPVVGSFKSLKAFKSTKFSWHYSGSFWWARSHKLFERNWRVTCRRWWASESYVGRHFTREEGYCLFKQLTSESLYDLEVWKVVDQDLIKWRENNELSKRLETVTD